MTTASALDRGRASFDGTPGQCVRPARRADQAAPLAAEDLERLARAAYLVGRDDESSPWERAHHECLSVGDDTRAARCAFWLALGLLLKGELARGGGWLARARRLLDDADAGLRGAGIPAAAGGAAEPGRGRRRDRVRHLQPGRRDRRALRRPGPDGLRPASARARR